MISGIKDRVLDSGRKSLTEAAKQIGCGTSTLGNYLNGSTAAGDDLLKKLATFLKVSEGEIPKRLMPDAPMKARSNHKPVAVIIDRDQPEPPVQRGAFEATARWLAAQMSDAEIQGAILKSVGEGQRHVARVLMDFLDERTSSAKSVRKGHGPASVSGPSARRVAGEVEKH